MQILDVEKYMWWYIVHVFYSDELVPLFEFDYIFQTDSDTL